MENLLYIKLQHNGVSMEETFESTALEHMTRNKSEAVDKEKPQAIDRM
jgi:hypothetical protein